MADDASAAHTRPEPPPPLLTILIPTYNRADRLETLLRCLDAELEQLGEAFAVVIGDNASTDRTPDVVATFKRRHPRALTVRHPQNVGPDENFCRCVEAVQTRYFWIIGDDDLPRAGAMRLVLALLAQESPDLVFLAGAARRHLAHNDPQAPVIDLRYRMVGQLEFARLVHINMTFITSVIVNAEVALIKARPDALRRHAGTHLVQLGWVFSALQHGSRFAHVDEICVLATEGNSGGFLPLQVFGHGFAMITRQTFGSGSALTRRLVGGSVLFHLPALMWALRVSKAGDFDKEPVARTLRPELGRYLGYWLFLLPIASLPMPLARLTLRLARKAQRLVKARNRLLSRLGWN